VVLKKFAFGKVIIQIAVKARLKYAPILFGSLVFHELRETTNVHEDGNYIARLGDRSG